MYHSKIFLEAKKESIKNENEKSRNKHMYHTFIFRKAKNMQCMYIKHDGSECHANAMAGSEYCWFHAPEIDYSRSDSQSKGGKAFKTGIYRELPVINLKTVNDIPELLMDTIRQLRQGFIGPRIAATIGYLAAGLTRSFEAGEISKRISRHEKFTRDGLTMLNEKLAKIEEKLPPH